MDPEDAAKNFWQWFKEKTTSPLYFTFAVMFVAWNWRLFSVLFLEDPNILGTTKISYIQEHVFNHTLNLQNQIGASLDSIIANKVYEFVPPAILTAIVIFILPWVADYVHQYSLISYFKRKLEYGKQYNRYRESLFHYREREAVLVEKAGQVEERIQRAEANLPDTEKWSREYESLIENSLSLKQALGRAERIIYGNRGYYQTSSPTEQNNYLSVDDLSLLEVFGTVKIIGESRNAIEFTQKGKHFLQLYKRNTK